MRTFGTYLNAQGLAPMTTANHIRALTSFKKSLMVLVCLDLKNAHNAYTRTGAQGSLAALGSELKDIAQAHRADIAHAGNVYMRNSKSKTGFIKVTTSTAGGPQRSPLTNVAFPVVINGPLKETERKFQGVEIKAIQDDCDIYGLTARWI